MTSENEAAALREAARRLAAAAMAAQTRGDSTGAMIACRHLICLVPNFSPAYSNLGVASQEQGDTGPALDLFHKAIRLDPTSAEALSNLGFILFEQGETDEAIAAFNRAIELRPGYVEALSNLGSALQQRGGTAEAINVFSQAVALDPNHAKAHNNLAQVLLRRGEYEKGWPEYEWRWRASGHFPRLYPQPTWDGSPPAGKALLLYAEQGLGDTLLFARFVPLVAAMGARVILDVQRPLASLLRQWPDVTVVATGDPLPPFDLHLPMPSLPLVFGTTLATVPSRVPYLHAEQTPIPVPFPSDKLKVGFVWAGNPRHKNDRNRSIAVSALFSLASIAGTQPYALQLERPGEAAGLGDAIDLAPYLTDFAATAAVLQRLDLLISVDTAVVHLAGALARPAWVLLPFSADWRWLEDRDESPWYPTARLFRQSAPGDWPGVVDRVARQLRHLVAGR
jgi:hypothetical protein